MFIYLLWFYDWWNDLSATNVYKNKNTVCAVNFPFIFFLPTVYSCFFSIILFTSLFNSRISLWHLAFNLFSCWFGNELSVNAANDYSPFCLVRTNTEIQFLNKWTMSITKIILFKYLSIYFMRYFVCITCNAQFYFIPLLPILFIMRI